MRPIPPLPPLRPRLVRRGRAGFTLLELVAVIGIIALMATVVVAGFSGIMKAVSATSGTDAMRRALNLARQQACVDGEDTYVWVTGVNTFAVVRKAGTVSSTSTGSMDFQQAAGQQTVHVPVQKKRKQKENGSWEEISIRWIVDDFADLASAGQSFSIDPLGATEDPSASEEQLEDLIQNYHGIQVFDMEAAKMADVEIPPWFSQEDDAWVFGIDSRKQGFAAGTDYGWLIYPEQTLPGGYVFKGSYYVSGDKAGDFNEGYDRKVHYRSDGTVEQGVTFELYEVAAKKTHKVIVDGSGKVTIQIENEGEDNGG